MVSVHFYKAKSLVGRIVQFFLQGTYVHCAIQVDGKHIIETDALKRAGISHVYQSADDIIILRDVCEKAVLERFNLIQNKNYDYAGAFAIKGWAKDDINRYTCVELTLKLLGLPVINITPDELWYNLKEGELICL